MSERGRSGRAPIHWVNAKLGQVWENLLNGTFVFVTCMHFRPNRRRRTKAGPRGNWTSSASCLDWLWGEMYLCTSDWDAMVLVYDPAGDDGTVVTKDRHRPNSLGATGRSV